MTKAAEIFNRALAIYTDRRLSEGAQYNRMQDYLWAQVKAGQISALEKCRMARDVMETAGTI
jgi:hypothetical protein